MWGVWQVKEQVWTSWDRFAAWKTEELAAKNLTELRKAYPEVQFEVRKYD